ncbi:MAG: hypothetical protein ACI943_001131 [Gammaproteobacteria bacterium]
MLLTKNVNLYFRAIFPSIFVILSRLRAERLFRRI